VISAETGVDGSRVATDLCTARYVMFLAAEEAVLITRRDAEADVNAFNT
jgi:hypothetical protein